MTRADEARDDLIAYHRALITNRTEIAVRIEQKYDFFGLSPQLVSLGLQAVTEGRDPWAAIEPPMEANDGQV